MQVCLIDQLPVYFHTAGFSLKETSQEIHLFILTLSHCDKQVQMLHRNVLLFVCNLLGVERSSMMNRGSAAAVCSWFVSLFVQKRLTALCSSEETSHWPSYHL